MAKLKFSLLILVNIFRFSVFFHASTVYVLMCVCVHICTFTDERSVNWVTIFAKVRKLHEFLGRGEV